MHTLGEYIISIVTASFVGAIIMALSGSKSSYSKILKMLCGIFIAITVISPLTDIRINEIWDNLNLAQLDAEKLVADGKHTAQVAAAEIIKEKTQAYIVDEANNLGLDISARVEVITENTPQLHKVVLSGNASSYNRKKLIRAIVEELDISEENIQWN